MKRVVLLLLFVALAPVASAQLSEFPGSFISNGAFSGQIVVGSAAPSTDVLAATEIALFLQQRSSVKITASSEDEFSRRGGILIGLPCQNSAVAEILGTSGCGIGLEEGEGYLKLLEVNGNAYLVVTGSSAPDTRKAARFLVTKSLSSVSSDEIRVAGTLDSPSLKSSQPLVIHEEPECSSDYDCSPEQACDLGVCVALVCPEGTAAESHDCVKAEAAQNVSSVENPLPLPELVANGSGREPPQSEEPESSAAGGEEPVKKGFLAAILSFFASIFS